MSVVFKRRTSIPAKDNKYYLSRKYSAGKNGYSNCVYSNTQMASGSSLYNCVSYGWARCIEACCTNGTCSDLGLTAKQMFDKRPTGNPADLVGKAPSWGTWKAKGTTPKVGDIIIWSGGATGRYAGNGHMAFVEKVYSNGNVDITDCYSSYSSKRKEKYPSGNGYFAYTSNKAITSIMGSSYTYKGLIRPNVTFR